MQCCRNISLVAYASNVECMYAGSHGCIFHCIEFIAVRYTDIVVSYQHMK